MTRRNRLTKIGDLGCFGVNVEEWQARNRAPVFPGKTNRWILLRSMNDQADNASITADAQSALAGWLKKVSGWDPVGETIEEIRVGPCDNIRVTAITERRLAFGKDKAAAVREQLPYPPMPFLASGPWVSVGIEFDWRSEITDMPWLTYHGGINLLSSQELCPVDADWILDEVGRPLRDSPPERAWGERVEEALQETGLSAVRALGVPLLVGGAVLGLLYLVLRKVT